MQLDQPVTGALVGSLRRSDPELEEVDRLIERRSRPRTDVEEEHERWRASERAYYARRRAALRWEWIRYFERLARSHRELSEANEAKARSLTQIPTEPTEPTEEVQA